jgi:hypothetical protein
MPKRKPFPTTQDALRVAYEDTNGRRPTDVELEAWMRGGCPWFLDPDPESVAIVAEYLREEK